MLSGIVFCIIAILRILCPSTGFIVGSAINASFTRSVFIIFMFVIMKLMLCCCGVLFLFSVKHTLDRASATGIVFLGLYLTWMSNFRHFSMNN